MLKRYQKHMEMLTEEDMKILNETSVCIIGAGGLGGYTVESLARMGFEAITVVDKDVFVETDYNRQLYANAKTMGLPKAGVVRKFIKKINDRVKINTMTLAYNERLGKKIIKDHDIVINAIDDPETALLLEKHCTELNIPLIYGVASGWFGQIGLCLPNSNSVSKLYSNPEHVLDLKYGNPSFSSAIVANMMVAEAIKLSLGKDTLAGKYLRINIENCNADIIEI